MWRKLRAWGALLAACGAWVILAAWLTGRIASDRFHLTQYLAWAPTFWLLGAGAALAVPALLLGVRMRTGRVLRWSAAAGVVLLGMYLAVVEWRLLGRPDHASPAWAVLSWNASNVEEDTVRKVLLAESPDFAAVVNAPWGANFRDLLPQWGTVVHTGPFLLASRHEILRWATADLGIAAIENGEPYDGRAMFAEVLVDGAPRVVWVLDMPSEPHLHRWTVTGVAAETLRTWRGTVYAREEEGGGWRSRPSQGAGFPRPDVVVGDFNIPRGSASLAALTEGMNDAFTQGGRGDPATWPRARPWWAIDQAFVRAPLRAIAYDATDPGEGDHRVVEVRIR